MSAGERVTHGLEDTALDVIRDQPLFHGVGSDDLSALLASADIRNLAAGETLLAPGDGNDCLFVVISGHLVLRVSDDEDAARVLGPGDLAGEVSLIANAPVYSRVIAQGAARVLTIPRTTLWRIAHREPVFTCNLLQYLARQLAGVGSAMRTARALQEEYRQHAHTDPLTGLFNRRWMDERLTFEIARSELRARPLCLMMIDIDHFKPYNDTHGHLAGDLVLQTVAATIRHVLRESDLAVRFGGEEVVVILPGTEASEALGVAGRLHRALSGSGYPVVGGTPLPRVTVSIGVAAWQAGDDAVRLIRRADRALYRAKDAGRNCTSM